MRARRRVGRAAQPRRAAARRGRRAGARLPVARRHRARRRPRTGRATRGRASSHDGFVWGRGALDMKSQTAAEVGGRRRAGARGLAAAARRAEAHLGGRRGGRRRGRRAVADRGAARTSRAATAAQRGRRAADAVRRPPAATASAAPRRARSASPCARAAAPGHASVPGLADNALLKLAPLLERLGAAAVTHDLTRRSRARCCRALGARSGGPRRRARAPARDRSAARRDGRADARA